jgi:hypothetical protein
VLVTGPPALAHAFAAQLQGTSVDAVPVSATQVAHAVRTGMRQVLARSAFAPSRPLSLVPSAVMPATDTTPAPRRSRRPRQS